MNNSIAENFMRSAKAPAISAGVMMANVIWNIMKTDLGDGRGELAARRRASCRARKTRLEAADERCCPAVKARL